LPAPVTGIIGVVSGLLGIGLGALGYIAPAKVFRPTLAEKKARRIAVIVAIAGVLTALFGAWRVLT